VALHGFEQHHWRAKSRSTIRSPARGSPLWPWAARRAPAGGLPQGQSIGSEGLMKVDQGIAWIEAEIMRKMHLAILATGLLTPSSFAE
jgi:hypothetical protein